MTLPIAGLIVAGGRSARFGSPKSLALVHGQPMLLRVYEVCVSVCDPVAIVTRPDAVLPPLPPRVQRLQDRLPDQGPLHGLAVGLDHLQSQSELVFVAACDMPWLAAEFVATILRHANKLDEYDAVVPWVGGRAHPLAAAYRTALAPVAWQTLADSERRLSGFLNRLRVRYLTEQDLPAIDSLRNVNRPEDLL